MSSIEKYISRFLICKSGKRYMNLLLTICCLFILAGACQQPDKEKPQIHASLTKAIDLFYDENRNEELLSGLNKIAPGELNTADTQLKKIVSAAALCELGKRDSALLLLDQIDQTWLDRDPYLLFWHRNIMGLILFRNNELSKSYAMLSQPINATYDECAVGLNKRILARISMSMDDYMQGLEFLLQSSQHYANARRTKSIAINEKLIGRCYMLTENYEEAFHHFKLAETELIKCNDELELFYVYVNILDYHLKQNNLKEAMQYARLSLSICNKYTDDSMFILVYNNLGEIAMADSDSKKASQYFLNVLGYCSRVKAVRSEIIANIGMTEALLNMDKPVAAAQYAHNAVATAKTNGQKQLCFMAYQNLANYYKQQSSSKAYAYLDTAMHYRDSTYQASSDIYRAYYGAKTDLGLASTNLILLKQKQEKRILAFWGVMIILAIATTFSIKLYNAQRNKYLAYIELVKRNKELSTLKKTQFRGNLNGVKIGEDRIIILMEGLKHLMEVEKIYCDPNLTISLLAEKLNTNREYLSQIINSVIGKNFTDYMNDFRVEEAKLIMSEQMTEKSKILSISGIAISAGFKNTSTFNPTFKRITGLTPSDYKKTMENASELTNS